MKIIGFMYPKDATCTSKEIIFFTDYYDLKLTYEDFDEELKKEAHKQLKDFKIPCDCNDKKRVA